MAAHPHLRVVSPVVVEAFSEKISIQMITLIALSRFIPMKANYEIKKKGTTMNLLTQFKRRSSRSRRSQPHQLLRRLRAGWLEKSITLSPLRIGFILFAVLLGCFALSPGAEAVVPAPDGSYPNFTTAEGQNALQNLTTGAGNTGVGWRALFADMTGSFNTGVGAGTLVLNTGDSNTAVGAAALLLNTAGNNNTASGAGALSFSTGDNNTAIGYQALDNNTTGGVNTAIGFEALFTNSAGAANTAIGSEALYFTTGIGNTAIGNGALLQNTTGNGNTVLGAGAGGAVTTADNVICIGANGANVSDTTWIATVYGVLPQSPTTAPVVVSNTGQLGTVASSERFKKDIATMYKASEAILSLRPVTFHYKTDTKGIPQFGLIAEEVAKVNPALVLPDKEGKPYTVRYDAVNAMLLNEFLKEHRKVQEQEASITQLKQDFRGTVAQQQKQIEALTAGLQKASAQLDAGKSAPQVVNNP